MPQLVNVRVSPRFEPADEADKKAMAAARKAGVVTLDYVTAMENIRNSRGMFEIAPDADAPVSAPAPRELEDMTIDELKMMMLQTGVTPQKTMTKAQVIKSIRLKLAQVEIVDEG